MSYDTEQYRPGACRYSEKTPVNRLVAHLYTVGDGIMDFKLPMCVKGWNADGGQSYSILRNNGSEAGLCRTCEKRAEQGLPGVLPKDCDLEEIFMPDEEIA